MNLRTRLVVGSAAAVALAVILGSALVYVLISKELHRQIDSTLRATTTTLENSNGHGGFLEGRLLTVPGSSVSTLITNVSFASYYQLVGGNGSVYIPDAFFSGHDLQPLGPTPAGVLAVASGQRKSFEYTTTLFGTRTRVLATHVSLGIGNGVVVSNEGLAVEVTTPLTTVSHELAQIRLWLLLISLGGVALACGAGLLVARSTLRPLRELSETAERVRATRDLSQRITVLGSDEVGQLAHTFNEMLAAIDEAATRQQRLVQDASHELRTPLTSLRTNIEVLANGGALPQEERAQLIHDVVGQIGELTELVSELTELARGAEQDEPFEPVRLDLVAEDAIARTQRNRPEVPIEAALAPTNVVGSAASLERAIANLLDNAAKWSPAGASVEIRLAGGELTVRDRGPGIAEADAPHVFERFYRATAARSMPGSGLGLAIVRRVAEAHGGSVNVEAAPGGGTLMRLRVPLDAAVAGSLERDAAAGARPAAPEADETTAPRRGPLGARRTGPHASPTEVRAGATRISRGARILRRRDP